MSGRERRSEDEFKSRWTEAGASPRELEVLCRELAPKKPRPSAERRLEAEWNRIEANAEAEGARKTLLSRLAVTGLSAACAAGIGGFVLHGAITPPPAPRPAPVSLPVGRMEISDGGSVHRALSGELVLDRGSVRVEIPRRAKGSPPIHFRAGDLRVEVIGTVFALRVEDGEGMVRVFEGAVMAQRGSDAPVRVDAEVALLPAAKTWPAAELPELSKWAEEAAVRRTAADSGSASASRFGSGLDPGQGPGPDSAPSAALETASASRPAPITERPAPIASRPAPITERPAPIAERPAPIVSRAVPTAARPAPSAESPDPIAPTPAIPAEVPPRFRAEVLAYKLAARLLDSDPASAARAFREYRASYPNGILIEEAELSLLEALRASGDATSFQDEAKRWLESHSDHAKAAELRALLKTTE